MKAKQMERQQKRKLEANPMPPTAKFKKLLTTRDSPDTKLVLKNMPSMWELICTEKEVKNADRDDLYSLAVTMKACRKWKAFSEVSSEKEDEDALPYFRRFVRAMKTYLSDSPLERAIPAMHDLAELMHINVSSVSYVLTELCSDPSEEVRQKAFALLEKNSYNLIKAVNLYGPKRDSILEQLSTILEVYARDAYISPETASTDEVNGDTRHPHPPNKEIATSIATFLFFQKEGMLRSSDRLDTLPYAISWASEHYDDDKIDFMIDQLSDLPRGFRKEIFLKIVIFANSEPIRECALDLLLEMGVHSVKSEVELGGLEDLVFVNSLLRKQFEGLYGWSENMVMPSSSLLH